MVWPIVSMTCGAIIVYLLARFFKLSNSTLAVFTALVFALTLALIWNMGRSDVELNIQNSTSPMSDALHFDYGAQLIAGLALFLSVLVAIYCGEYLKLDRRYHVFYPLLLLMIAGLTGMVFSVDLFAVYLFCELMSICAYALVAFRKDTDTAIEAGYKYLIMGSVSTIMVLLGIALIFFATGNLSLENRPDFHHFGYEAGIICIFVGLCVKCSVVPMHTWLPDAHGRAPSSISALLSGIIVQSVLFVLVKTCLLLRTDSFWLGTIIVTLAVGNILVGNVLALVQNHTKRLLGYSTIAQLGYMMLCVGMGLRNGSLLAFQAFFILVIQQAISKALAFLSKGNFHFYTGASLVKDLIEGAGQIPLTAGLFSLALLSLSGLPPLVGFTGKWMLLTSMMENFDRLGIIALIFFLAGSVIGLGYYLSIVVMLFQRKSSEKEQQIMIQNTKTGYIWMVVPMCILGFTIIFFSVAPNFLIRLTENAAILLNWTAVQSRW